MNDPAPSKATVAADREVRRLHAAERRLHEDRTAARAAILAADERLATAALAGGEPLDTAALTAAQARERAAGSATDAAREQRDAAIRDLFKAQAADRRVEADRLRAEAEKRQARTDKLLAELEAHEGIPYGPGIVAHHALDARPVFGRPLTARMRFEADDLERQAVELERQTPSRSGSAAGGTVAEVLEAAGADQFQIAPRLDVLEEKAKELLDAERARRSRLLPHYANYVAPDAVLHLEIVWQDGALVESRCRCVSAEVAA